MSNGDADWDDSENVARLIRGGYWIEDGREMRSAARWRGNPSARYVGLGFRLALHANRPGQAPGGGKDRE